MAIPEWVEEIPVEHQPAALALLAGPEEVRVLLERAAAEREMGKINTEPPEWVLRAVRDLRPLSRKFIVRCFAEVGLDFPENDWTRSLGFGDGCNWTPIITN
jgi:hypothetical protein